MLIWWSCLSAFSFYRRDLEYFDYLLQRSNLHQNKEVSLHDTKLYLRVRPLFMKSGEYGLPLNCNLLLVPLWHGVLEPIQVPSMSQIDLPENDSYSIGSCEKNETTTQKIPLPRGINQSINISFSILSYFLVFNKLCFVVHTGLTSFWITVFTRWSPT